ncbi:MAG: hypothetical protein LBO04_00025 [Spirochaetaceae bacterium]|jgi:hypothetical protein|nr:hypothetical protein [Spirochaetaceae bacterium]
MAANQQVYLHRARPNNYSSRKGAVARKQNPAEIRLRDLIPSSLTGRISSAAIFTIELKKFFYRLVQLPVQFNRVIQGPPPQQFSLVLYVRLFQNFSFGTASCVRFYPVIVYAAPGVFDPGQVPNSACQTGKVHNE